MHGTSGQAVTEMGRHLATILCPFLSRIGRLVRVANAVLTPVVLALLISSTAIAQGQAAPTPDWQYGGFLDVAYLNSFNDPSNHEAAQGILRLEYRYDDSRGVAGGFFNDGEVRPGVVGL